MIYAVSYLLTLLQLPDYYYSVGKWISQRGVVSALQWQQFEP